MANIIRRNERRNQNADLAPMFSPMWEPLQILRELGSLGWPHRGLEAFREIGPMMMERAFAPRFDVKETRDAYVFTADMPGVRDDDLEISVTGNHLSISGRREEEERQEDEQYYAYERSFGTFTRNFSLPEGADPERVNADFKNGVLRISVGKRPEVQPRRVSISGGGEKGKEKVIQAAESGKESTKEKMSGSSSSPSHGSSTSSTSTSSSGGESSAAGSSGSMSESAANKPGGDKNKPNR
jgi:HSP20 family protein